MEKINKKNKKTTIIYNDDNSILATIYQKEKDFYWIELFNYPTNLMVVGVLHIPNNNLLWLFLKRMAKKIDVHLKKKFFIPVFEQ